MDKRDSQPATCRHRARRRPGKYLRQPPIFLRLRVQVFGLGLGRSLASAPAEPRGPEKSMESAKSQPPTNWQPARAGMLDLLESRLLPMNDLGLEVRRECRW